MKKFFSNIKSTLMIIYGLLLILLSACGVYPNKHLHGEDLLKLSDEMLFETVYLQNLDRVESFPDEDIALSQISAVQRTVYILSIYDMEIQNGGLCQFFVNSSSSLAPYVVECMETVGAEEHIQLFTEFVSSNQLDLHNLDSFEIFDIEDSSDTGFLADTPGFSMLDFSRFDFFKLEELEASFREFRHYQGKCRYSDCAHFGEGESECAVMRAVKDGNIPESRFESYR